MNFQNLLFPNIFLESPYLNSKNSPSINPKPKQNKINKNSLNKLISTILSPIFNLVLKKEKNYKYEDIKLNYLRILNSHIKNSYPFSNTNKNFIDYSLKKDVFLLIKIKSGVKY